FRLERFYQHDSFTALLKAVLLDVGNSLRLEAGVFTSLLTMFCPSCYCKPSAHKCHKDIEHFHVQLIQLLEK
ncbi:Protein of unknown function, partial [Gryllus bimaculatus]